MNPSNTRFRSTKFAYCVDLFLRFIDPTELTELSTTLEGITLLVWLKR
jgi:hypothetical protein